MQKMTRDGFLALIMIALMLFLMKTLYLGL